MMQMLMQLLTMGNNPQQIIQDLMVRNPQAQIVLNQMQQSGMNPKQYAMQYARQNNINLQPFINTIGQRGIRL